MKNYRYDGDVLPPRRHRIATPWRTTSPDLPTGLPPPRHRPASSPPSSPSTTPTHTAPNPTPAVSTPILLSPPVPAPSGPPLLVTLGAPPRTGARRQPLRPQMPAPARLVLLDAGRPRFPRPWSPSLATWSLPRQPPPPCQCQPPPPPFASTVRCCQPAYAAPPLPRRPVTSPHRAGSVPAPGSARPRRSPCRPSCSSYGRDHNRAGTGPR